MKRPLAIYCLLLVCVMLWVNTQSKAPPFYLTEEQKSACVMGWVDHKEYKKNQVYIYISNVIFIESDYLHSEKNFNLEMNPNIQKKMEESERGCLCYLAEESQIPSIGETIILNGSLEDFLPATSPGMFDQKEYYEKKGLHFLVFQGNVLFVEGEENSVKEVLFSFRKQMVEALCRELGEENAGVLATMLLGDKSYLEEDIKKGYQYSGISHVLAISGLHISILGYGLFALLKRMRCPQIASSILTVIFLILYGVMVGGSIATLRATIMFFVYLGSKVFKRPYDLLTALSLSAAIIIFINPNHFDVGFFLSFAAVLGLAILRPIFVKKIPESMKFLKILVAGSCIFSVTVPILMYFYFGFAPLSMLSNLLVIPLMSLLLVTGVGLIMTSMSFPFLCLPFRILCQIILFIYKNIVIVSELIPKYFLLTGKPDLWQVILYYLLLTSLVFIEKKGWKVDMKLRLLVSILTLFLVFYLPVQKNLQVEVLDVGQGDGIYIETGTGYSLFIDGGSTSVKDMYQYRLEPYLKCKGIKKIDYLFITHYDMDHMNGWITYFEDLLERNKKAQILEVTNLVISAETIYEEKGERLLGLARDLGIKIYTIEEGDVMDFSGVTLRCIYPGEELTDSDNGNSLVLLLTKGNFSILFTGDLEAEGEELARREVETLFKQNKIDSIEVLKVGHHGSSQASSSAFLETVAADLGVISYGRDNTYGHPSDEVLDRLDEAGMYYYGTGNDGAVLIESDGEKYWVETFN